MGTRAVPGYMALRALSTGVAGTPTPFLVCLKRFLQTSSLRYLCAFTLVFTLRAFSATPAVHFTRISVEQGLSQSTVQAILQDHAGFIWFGTEEGLNRYDGYA